MIIQKHLVDRTRHYLGLNMYETQLWLALLSHGVATAGELAEAANVPRSRSYDVLDSLSQKGLVVMKSDERPLKYMAVPPEQAIENLKRFYGRSAEDNKSKLENLKGSSHTKDLTDLFKKGEAVMELPELIGLVRNNQNVWGHTLTMLNKSKKHAKFLLTSHDVSTMKSFYLDAVKNAKARGVKVQILMPTGTDSGELSKYAEVKMVDTNFPRGVITDGSEAMMLFMDPAEVHASFDSGVWVSSEYVAGTMDKFFEATWNE
ncbi:MAG: TrmB family transcriptional regulator [Candidatus Altiarchaeota archaeon]|nr:TrmB family transcriptional regulator [Candidatus Altiarchaeota archaeon]